MKPDVYSYVRFSRPEQSEGDSLRRQTSMRDEWLAKKGLTLVDAPPLSDLGVSAYRGKNLTTGALSVFIEAVKKGRIRKGSYLVIEKLDRFSRADGDVALTVFTQLVKAGITIVTLDPAKEWNQEAIKSFGIMELVMHFVLANQESEKKAARLSAAWKNKKRNASTKLLTKQVPLWLKVENGKIVKDPAKVKIIQRCFALAEKGYGSGQIAIMLNREKVPARGKGNGWYGSSVSRLLRCRQVLGEYQPCSLTTEGPKRRVADGEPVRGYYPSIISEAQWHRVQRALDGRRLSRGNVGRAVNNLFLGLIHDARDGGKVRSKKIGRFHYLLSKNADRGLTDKKFSFGYDEFEEAILTYLHELKASDLKPHADDPADDTEQKIGRLGEIERRTDSIKKRLLADSDFDALMDVLATLEAEKKSLVKEISTARLNAPEIQKRDLAEAVSIMDSLAKAKGDELLDLRASLKGLIRSLIESVWILVEPWGDGGKICFAQLNFKSGGSRMIHIASAGKGVSHYQGQPLTFYRAGSQKIPVLMPLLDLREYQSNELTRATYDQTAEQLQAGHPQNIAVRRIQAGEKPNRIAKEMGIANSTVYRWRDLVA